MIQHTAGRTAQPEPGADDPSKDALRALIERSDSPTEPRLSDTRRPAPSSATRLIVMTGLIVSLFLLLIAYLDRSTRNSTIFGCLTIFFFLVLLRVPRKD